MAHVYNGNHPDVSLLLKEWEKLHIKDSVLYRISKPPNKPCLLMLLGVLSSKGQTAAQYPQTKTGPRPEEQECIVRAGLQRGWGSQIGRASCRERVSSPV